MIEQELIKRNFVGKDGFIWWIGQVASEEKWNSNIPGNRVESPDDIKGFGDRYRVRILGYHTDNSLELTDDDLPWASVMLPVTAGSGSGASSQSPQIRQGNFVFGFFLDGEDAQQPIIMGVLGYNNYTVVSKGVPQIKYVPFDGFKPTDTVPEGSIREIPGGSEKTSTPDSVPQADSSGPKTSDGTTISGSSAHQLKSVAEKVQEEEGKKISAILQTEPCGSSLDAALLDMQEGIKEIHRLRSQINSWAGTATGNVNNLQERVQRVTERMIKNVTKPLKDLMDEIRKWVITEVENKAKDFYFLLFPEERSEMKVLQSEVIEIISCLFNKIIKGLLEIVAKTILSFVDKVINVGTCIVDNVMGGIIGQIGGLVNGLINLALGPLNSLLSSVNGVIDLGQSILGLFFDVLGFFKCEENPKCSEYKQWSVWDGTTINEINKIGTSITNVLQKAESVKTTTANALNSAGSVFGSVDQALNSFDPAGFIDASLSSCISEIIPIECGPPKVSIFGGGGTGAAGNAIIGRNGEIMGVDLVKRGFGYITAPFVSVQDPCGRGNGAVMKAKLREREEKNNYGVSVGGTTGINYASNVGDIDISRDESPLEGNTYRTIPSEWTNVGIVTDKIVPFDNLDISLDPALTLEMSPPGGIINAGDSIVIRYRSQNANKILYSNFGATTLGNIIDSEKNIRVAEVTFEDITRPKTFILSVANEKNSVTAVLRVDIRKKNIDGEIIDQEIDEIIVEEPGYDYLSGPDGSLGGMGRTWAKNNQTIVKRFDGTYDTPYNPGQSIKLLPGDTVRTPSETSFVIDQDSEVVSIPPRSDYVIEGIERPEEDRLDLDSLSQIEINLVSPNIKDDTNNLVFSNQELDNPYLVILELYDIEILNGGINYSSEDTFVVLPEENNIILKPILGPFGTIVDVEVISTGKGFTTYPNIYIKSETGFNAKFAPKFRVNRIPNFNTLDELNEILNIDKTKVVQVIDCVGKFTR
jgi:hypothetical protein